MFTAAGVTQQATPIVVPALHLPQPLSPPQYGPYNAHVLAGGPGLTKYVSADDPILNPQTPWTISAWIEFAAASPSTVLIAGGGDPVSKSHRFFALIDGQPAFRLGDTDLLVSETPFALDGWHFLAATSDGGTTRFYVDGVEAAHRASSGGTLSRRPIAPILEIAPVAASCVHLPCPHFGGRIAAFTLARDTMPAEAIAALAHEPQDPELVEFEEASKPWPLQVVQFAGNTAPQEPWTMPHRNAPFGKPVAAPLPPSVTTLVEGSPGDWTLTGGWKLIEAPKASASSNTISTVGLDVSAWMPATVPGTVLTTMIDRGLYPDPDFGLNNLAIPEKLNRQDYWYRAEFLTPSTAGRPQLSLLLDGINYRAEIWLNGQLLGHIAGAFTRGSFDVTHALRPGGNNALAIRIFPVPHPGIPNVQSIALGSGLNGGAMELDGPTFVASEGWDWNPPMHDRDTGLWQGVHLVATGPVSIEDEQVITQLALPDNSTADVTLTVPLSNLSGKPVTGTLIATFEGGELRKHLTVPPAGSIVQLSPADFPTLHLTHPRLWWPNGYGLPELYHLTTTFIAEGYAPTVKKLRFGVREITYELSLLDNQGQLRRVAYALHRGPGGTQATG